MNSMVFFDVGAKDPRNDSNIIRLGKYLIGCSQVVSSHFSN